MSPGLLPGKLFALRDHWLLDDRHGSCRTCPQRGRFVSARSKTVRPGDICAPVKVTARLDDLDCNYKMRFLDRNNAVLVLSVSDMNTWHFNTRLLIDDHPIRTIVGNRDLRVASRCA